jgi:hypothetical protein
MVELVRVGVVFGVDREAQKAFNEAYGCIGLRSTDKVYFYRSLQSLGLKVNDLAVVNTPQSGATVVTVKSVEDFEGLTGDFTTNLKWVMAKVDFGVTADLIAKEKRREQIVRELTKLAEAERKKLDFRNLLADNEQGQRLMQELESLG